MVKEIADHFQRSPVTIGEAIMKVEDLLKRDKSFEKGLKRMEENLVKRRKKNTELPKPDPISFFILVTTLEKPESKDSIKGVFGISDQVYKRIIDKAKKEIFSIRKGISMK